ncbi:putative 3-isopropylmalate dehydratase, large subunit [Hyphomonas neptunium ATCC 15444]|uniref:3-isopropylmalate dehydratase n=2 Tax=Hyphomonas TaxID=85 RepID=Q0C395_HYPNA|nr:MULTISPECIES: 3-isopropylmalate dehydratase large subunit [Hyphomonas]ABI78440.1 putative 3-isopropylmalate dehydratase, large subunit [Hyphomonas neptunium ATCC 15444]KCZ95967.1 isopropylmalate isomerase large subunit [Hyphomonas hirschiana VP5]
MATLFDKLWDMHRVGDAGDGDDLIAIDRLLLHERTGGVALKSLAAAGHRVRDPARVFSIMDHIVSFRHGRGRDEARSPGGEAFIVETREMAQTAGIHLIDTDNPAQGIVHVVAPELGIALPGLTLVCPDSHTCSLGALGALAWGIGSSDAEHAMATGTLRAAKPRQMLIRVAGRLSPGVSAKDLALYIIARFGSDGGKRCAIEYAGEAISDLSIEGRLTLCNMAVEFAAFTALIAPDAKTLDYVSGRPFSPSGAQVETALAHWQTLRTDEGAEFDEVIEVDAGKVAPQVSWGTSPEDSLALTDALPADASARALAYMGLTAGQSVKGLAIGGAFIGSCTNGRLSDLKAAAEILKGRRVAPGVRAVCVPGSQAVSREAEALGIDRIFKDAGFEWGAPGCAMCFYAGGETFPPETRVMSSTNRNFEGRQGPGVRTHLASPAVVAASAIAGRICAPSDILVEGGVA